MLKSAKRELFRLRGRSRHNSFKRRRLRRNKKRGWSEGLRAPRLGGFADPPTQAESPDRLNHLFRQSQIGRIKSGWELGPSFLIEAVAARDLRGNIFRP